MPRATASHYDGEMRPAALTVPVLALALTLTACAGSPPEASRPDAPTSPTETAAPDDGNLEACEYLAENTLTDAVDFFEAYNVARDTADPAQLDSIVNRLNVASTATSGPLSRHIDAAVGELEAIQTRYETGDQVDPAVDYQVLADSLDGIMGECLDVAK